MYRRSKDARLLTGGLIGALPVTTPGDEHWNDVSLLIRGDTLTDLSGNHTIINNGVTVDTGTYKYSSGGSMSFDGSSDYLSLGNVDVLNIAGGGDWTVEAWVYTADLSNFQMIASYGGGAAEWNNDNGHNWNIFYGTSVAYIQYWTGSARQDVTAVHGMSPNTWNHIAASYDGTTVRLFINGSVIASSTTAPGAISNPQNMVIGDTASFDTPLQGNIEDIRITKGVARYITPPTASFLTNAPVVGRRGVGTTGTAEATATLRTRGYVGAAPAGSGGMLTLYDRYIDALG